MRGLLSPPKPRVLEDAARAESVPREQAVSSRLWLSCWCCSIPWAWGVPGQLGGPWQVPREAQPAALPRLPGSAGDAWSTAAFPLLIEEAKRRGGLGGPAASPAPTEACSEVGWSWVVASPLYRDGSLGTCGSSRWTSGALGSLSKGQSEPCHHENLLGFAW